MDASDRSYALAVAILRERFAPQSTTSGSLAVTAMETLDQISRVLVQQGLLPPFTPALNSMPLRPLRGALA
jgi:hypothetical protein